MRKAPTVDHGVAGVGGRVFGVPNPNNVIQFVDICELVVPERGKISKDDWRWFWKEVTDMRLYSSLTAAALAVFPGE